MMDHHRIDESKAGGEMECEEMQTTEGVKIKEEVVAALSEPPRLRVELIREMATVMEASALSVLLVTLMVRVVNELAPEAVSAARSRGGAPGFRPSLAALVVAYEAVDRRMETETDAEKLLELMDGPLLSQARYWCRPDPDLLRLLPNCCASSALVGRLASTKIFGAVLKARHEHCGARLVYRVEFVLFIVLAVGVLGLVYRQFVASKDAPGEQAFCLALSGPTWAYFLCRELAQIWQLRKLELVPPPGTRRSTCVSRFWSNPLAFAGLPRAWRADAWNWVDVCLLVSVGMFVIDTAVVWALTGRPPSYLKYEEWPSSGKYEDDDAVRRDVAVCAAAFVWVKLLGSLRNMSVRFVVFVSTLEQVFYDIWHFLVVFIAVLVMFTNIFMIRLSRRENFDFDDDEVNEFRHFWHALQYLYTFSFLGVVDLDQYPGVQNKFDLDVFIFVVYLVMLNVLIAVVSESYDNSMARAHVTFKKARLEHLMEIILVFPARNHLKIADLGRYLRRVYRFDSEEAAFGDADTVTSRADILKTFVSRDLAHILRTHADDLLQRLAEVKLDDRSRSRRPTQSGARRPSAALSAFQARFRSNNDFSYRHPPLYCQQSSFTAPGELVHCSEDALESPSSGRGPTSPA